MCRRCGDLSPFRLAGRSDATKRGRLSAWRFVRRPMASPATMPLGETIETPAARGQLLWAGCFSFALACHLGAGLSAAAPECCRARRRRRRRERRSSTCRSPRFRRRALSPSRSSELPPDIDQPEIAAGEPAADGEDIAAPIEPPEPIALPPVAGAHRAGSNRASPRQPPRIRAEPDRAEAERAARARAQKARERAEAARGRERSDDTARRTAAARAASLSTAPAGSWLPWGRRPPAAAGASAAASAAWREPDRRHPAQPLRGRRERRHGRRDVRGDARRPGRRRSPLGLVGQSEARCRGARRLSGLGAAAARRPMSAC